MHLHIPAPVIEVCRTLQEAGHQAVVVGGAVRSLLILRGNFAGIPRLPPKDYDVATSARPEVVQALFLRVLPTGIEHGTVTVLLDEEPRTVEVTTFRTDGKYSDGRRPESVAFVSDLVEDLKRRDFTINAMAYDPVSGELTDLFGGMQDLENMVIRAVGDPAERFAEDALRILRAARFAAQLCYDVDVPTMHAMRDQGHLIRKVSRERVRDELFKMLEAPGVSCGTELLLKMDLISPVVGETLDKEMKKLSVGAEIWECLVELAPVNSKLAALLWPLRDQGKELRSILQDLKLPSAVEKFTWEVLHFPRITGPFNSEPEVRVLMAAHRPEVLDAAVTLQQIVHDQWVTGISLKKFWEIVGEQRRNRVPLQVSNLAVDGKQLREAGVQPGPRMGRILAAMMARVIQDPQVNTRESLLAVVAEIE